MKKIFKDKSFYNLIGIFFAVFVLFFITKNVSAYWAYFEAPGIQSEICGYEDTQEDICNKKLQETYSDPKLKCELTPNPCNSFSDFKPIAPQPNTGDGNPSKKYELLAPIGEFKDIETNNIGEYFNKIFLILIGLAGALAVIMIIIGGVEWMGTDSVFGKTEAKQRITSALLGLLIALAAYAILNTINPALLGKGGLKIDQVNIKLEGDVNAPVSVGASGTAKLSDLGIICNKSGGYSSITSIAKSFNGKMTYSQDIPKGQVGSNNTVKYDCSGFVNAVLQCSGINTSSIGINSGTSVIFSVPKAEKVTSLTSTTINGKELQVGDLIGWKPSDDKDKNGHVMIYIGNGLVADSHGPSGKTGKAYGEFSLEKYKDRIKYLVKTQTL